MIRLHKYISPYRFFTIPIFLIIASVNPVFGAKDHLVFNNLTTASGLSESNITCFFQDHEGFMWIGTTNGLNKYDGAKITVYKYQQKDSTSLPSSYISLIYEDSDNELFIGTYKGLSKYNREQDNFKRIFTTRENSIYHYNTTAILDKDSNSLWIGTYNGCYILDKRSNKLTPYTNQFFKEGQDQHFNNILQDPKGNFWFSILDSEKGGSGIFKLYPESQKIEHFHTEHAEIPLKENEVYCMFIDVGGDVWIGYHSMGIDVIREGERRIDSYIHDPCNSNSLSNNRILSIKRSINGMIVIGTNGGGLNLLNPVSGNFKVYTNTISERSLLSNTIQKVFIGKDGMMWLGCWGGGVSIYDRRFDKFSLYNTEKLEDKSTLLNNVTCFAQDKNDKIWIATDGEGIFYYDPINEDFKNIKRFLISNKILAIEADTMNGLWAGTWGEGLLYFKIHGDELRLVKRYDVLSADTPNSNSYFTLFIDKKGTLWVGSFGKGLWFFNDNTQLFERIKLYNKVGDLIDWMSVRSITEDSEGYIWAATELNGLFKLDPQTKNSKVYVHDAADSTSIINDNLNFVFEDSKKNLWIGFEEDGLGLFDRKRNLFHNFNTEDGLPHNTIVGILEDNNGSLWLSSLIGISKVVPDYSDQEIKIHCSNYSVYDGLQDRKFNRWAYYKSKSGQMYFGGTKGFNVFSPDNIPKNNDPPPVCLTDFLLFKKPVSIGGQGSPLTKHISKTEKVVLEHYQSSITIKYIAVNFIFSERNQYAYYLEGFDTDSMKWNYVGNSREASYTNLDPGEYIFHVKASNNDGVWNDKGTSIAIEILPPWWKTLWFRIIMVLTVAGILFAFYSYRVSNLTKQKIRLEKLVKVKTADLFEANALLGKQSKELLAQKDHLEQINNNLNETNSLLKERQIFIESQSKQLRIQNKELKVLNATKDKFFSIIAHDLRNPFSTVLGFSELLAKQASTMDRTKMGSLLDLLHISSQRVYSLLENLLQWSRAQSGNIKVKIEEVSIDEIVRDNLQLVQDMADKKNIKINNSIPKGTKLFTDHNLLDAVIRNLITNAIKFTENGSVEIFTNPSEASIELCIKDTGVGIPSDKIKNLFRIDKNTTTTGTRDESGTGLGLLICKEFIEMIEGKLNVQSKVGEGSLFIISLPKISA